MTSPAPSELASTTADPRPGRRPRLSGRQQAALGIGLPLLVGLVHVGLVAPHYHVGSFDDDASYILAAKALLAGHGLTGHLTSGEVVVGLYPPGYSALIAPLLWIWPHSSIPLRALSSACFAALFPLMWVWLGRRRIGPGVRSATLLVLALGPPIATYASMVMAEAPFLVVLVLLLLAVDSWMASRRLLAASTVAVIGLAASLVWLKQAGIGLVAGLFLWLLLGRHTKRLARAALLAGGVGLTLVPVVVSRLSAGIPLAGSRYSMELGAFYSGGLANRLHHVLPASLWHLLSTAVPATLVPYLEPLPIRGHWPDLWKILSWHVTILIVIGAVTWARRYRDPIVAMAVIYLFESALWPFVNERRAILVLPVLVAWYVLGAVRLWRWLRRAVEAAAPPRVGAAILATAVVIGPLAAQMPRDYLFSWSQSSSRIGGSPYAALLRQLGTPDQVVETDYRSSVALFTGHSTNWTAFTSTQGLCFLPGILQAISQDRAGFLLLGDLNKPGQIDSPCLASQVKGASWAVPLLHSQRDDAAVYELVGPGTGHPGSVDPSLGRPPTVMTGPTGAVAVITFARPSALTQVSVGRAYLGSGPRPGTVVSVSLQIERPGRGWEQVAYADGPVGGAAHPYLIGALDHPQLATAVRVVIRPAVSSGAADLPGRIGDLATVGPATAGIASSST